MWLYILEVRSENLKSYKQPCLCSYPFWSNLFIEKSLLKKHQFFINYVLIEYIYTGWRTKWYPIGSLNKSFNIHVMEYISTNTKNNSWRFILYGLHAEYDHHFVVQLLKHKQLCLLSLDGTYPP
jgi:hypothetical protein